jgi:hypothetical protein
MPLPEAAAPIRPEVAVVAIHSLFISPVVPEDIARALHESNEPYRHAAYLLGWGPFDGSDWWHEVMDLIG